MATEDLNGKIAAQIKYYFSDFNLSRDKFMKMQMSKDDGWIPLEVLLTFKKLAALTTDPLVVAGAIKALASDLIEVDEEFKKIRRTRDKPLVEDYQEQVVKKTVHIKGFPLTCTFDQLWTFCSTFGELESLLMRRRRKGDFKGCVLAVYKEQTDADKIIDLTLKYDEKDLLKEKEIDHLARKKLFFENKKKRKDSKGQHAKNKGGSGSRDYQSKRKSEDASSQVQQSKKKKILEDANQSNEADE